MCLGPGSKKLIRWSRYLSIQKRCLNVKFRKFNRGTPRHKFTLLQTQWRDLWVCSMLAWCKQTHLRFSKSFLLKVHSMTQSGLLILKNICPFLFHCNFILLRLLDRKYNPHNLPQNPLALINDSIIFPTRPFKLKQGIYFVNKCNYIFVNCPEYHRFVTFVFPL